MIKRKILFLQLCAFVTAFICCKQQPVFSQNNKTYDLVKDFNAWPDNNTDNYAAFAKAAEVLSKAGGGFFIYSKG